MAIERINPQGMASNPVYSQAVILPAGRRMLIIGGQNAVDANGEIIGKGDLAAQADKAIENLLTCLKAAGGTLDDLAKMTIYVVGDADIRPALSMWLKHAAGMKAPPAVGMIRVLGLGRPEFLIEIEAIASVA